MPAKLVYRSSDIGLDGRERIVMGRHRECDLVVNDRAASRQHTRLERRDRDWWVVDLGSSNGTKVNGKRIAEPVRLADGDLIGIGESEIGYQEQNGTRQGPAAAAPLAAAPSPAPGGDVSPGPAPLGGSRPIRAEEGKVYLPADLVGSNLAGYRLTGIIDQRPTGTVFGARQLKLDRQVAVKVLSHEIVRKHPALAARILDAARQAGRLSHQGIVKIHECGFDDGLLWYSMEYVEGDILGRRLKAGERIDIALVLLIAERLASALKEIHQLGMAHCDLRPDNVLISNTGLVKLVDVGVAPLLQEARQLLDGSRFRGNALYTSPEYARDPLPRPSADIYSLGCLLFHAATGRPPFPGHRAQDIVAAHESAPVPHISELVDGLPEEFDVLIHGMLAKNPAWRFDDIAECQATMARLRQDLVRRKSEPALQASPRTPPVRRPVASRPNAERTVRRRSGPWLALVLLVLAVVAAVAVWPRIRRTLAIRGGEIATSHDPVGAEDPRTVPPERPPGPVETTRPTGHEQDPLAARWQEVKVEVARHREQQQWGSAQFILQAFRTSAEQAGAERFSSVAASQLRQLEIDAASWYQAEMARLAAIEDARKRLNRLSELRELVASGQRSDIESRHRETLSELLRELAVIRRDVVALIESGRAIDVADLVGCRAGLLAGTPYADLEQQLANQAAECIHMPWAGDWQSTRRVMAAAGGEAALGAAATFLLMGDRPGAMRLLFGDPALAKGELAKRRDALLASQTILLDFASPADLGHFSIGHGEVVSVGGVLRGTEGEAARIDCSVAIGGADWEVALIATFTDRQSGASAQLSLVDPRSDASTLDLRIEGDRLTLISGASEIDGTRSSGPLHLGLRCVRGQLRALVGDSVLADRIAVDVPPGSRLRLEVNGMAWSIDELQVIGGRR